MLAFSFITSTPRSASWAASTSSARPDSFVYATSKRPITRFWTSWWR